MTNSEKQQLQVVRRRVLKALASCQDIPSTVALAALVEVTVDSAVSICGKSQGVEALCRCINALMATKHNK